MPAELLDQRGPRPYKTAGLALVVVAALALGLLFGLFRGGFTDTTDLTMMSSRAGLVLEPGSKVTFNGVEIGKVARTDVVDVDGAPKAKITVEVDSGYVERIPANVEARVSATTVFGNKYVALSSPKDVSAQHITGSDVVDVTSVTTEFNTLFETVLSISEKVDPVKLNQSLAAAAEALDGLGDRFRQSLDNGNEILAEVNPQMPQIRRDTQLVADLGELYADAAPDLLDGLENAVTTARTVDEQRASLDQALMAAVGLGNTGGDIFERSGPYLVRSTEDLVTTSRTLDYHSPALYCSIRNYHDVEPKFSRALGGKNGYSGIGFGTIVGAGNPYIYPDNLPRVNATGGPEGRPGCWQPITRDLWPAPYLVMDTGASIAPYNHFELGQPILIEYVWGRQIGENTINP